MLVATINLEALSRDRDQLFAEAVIRFKRGDHWWPDVALEQQVIRPEQETRYESGPVATADRGLPRRPKTGVTDHARSPA